MSKKYEGFSLPAATKAVSHCPSCLFPARGTRKVLRSGYFFELCRSCSLLFMNPSVSQEDQDELYAGPYWEGTNARRTRRYRFEKQFRRAVFFDWLCEKSGVPKGGRVLEIGSGFGGVVWALARLRDMEPFSIELDHEACMFQQQLGVSILDPRGEKAASAGEFDLVVLSHVLEHQLKPRELLETAFDLLSPTGTMLIEVPHQNFVVDGSIEHPLSFSKYALDRLLRDFAGDVRYKIHGGLGNVVLPPKYLAAAVSLRKGSLGRAVPYRLPRAALWTSKIASAVRQFGPLLGLNSRLSAVMRSQANRQVNNLFDNLPHQIRSWLEGDGDPDKRDL